MRVIAGGLRGRSIRAPRGSATRPTTDRVREALFEVLGDVSQVRLVDLYAGSGALGIEALSRGARAACFVESSNPAVGCIRANLDRLGLADRAVVIRARVESAHARLRRHGPFDLVLCDPPWVNLEQALRAVARLLQTNRLADGSTVVVVHPSRQPIDCWSCPGLTQVDRRTWGDSAVSLFRAG